MSVDAVLEAIKEVEDYKKFNKLEFYVPYDFQKEFHRAKGFGEFHPVPSDLNQIGLAIQRALMCANQIGKTYCGAMEVAFHLTGRYPKKGEHFYPEYWPITIEGVKVKCPYAGKDIWPNGWDGHVFRRPIKAIIGSNTNETARDICQKELLGDPSDEKSLGTGTIPKKFIKKTNRKPGVVNAFDSVVVQHISGGNSEAYFRAYEQGKKKFMGHKYHYGWPDEEPPADIWAQILRSMLSTKGVAGITFTPEEGLTEVVIGFMNEIQPGQALLRAGWDDAPHMVPEERTRVLGQFKPHERDMRSKGDPMLGSGLVFPVDPDMIRVDPIPIQPHWPRLNGIDFGWDHPFACAFGAWDRDTDTVYIYDGYKESRALPPMHAEAIKRRGDWIPVAWPKDGLQTEKGSGRSLAERYRDLGVPLHHTYFTNPPALGEQEGKGSQSVEAGIMEMLEMMETGRLKVFSTVTPFWEELSTYHRKEGKIVPYNDDFMSATRYMVNFRRHAEVKMVRAPTQHIPTGLGNW